jgi:hypothetical protein
VISCIKNRARLGENDASNLFAGGKTQVSDSRTAIRLGTIFGKFELLPEEGSVAKDARDRFSEASVDITSGKRPRWKLPLQSETPE